MSPSNSGVDLAQLVLTGEQAIKLGEMIASAGRAELAADQAVEELRKYGPAAARLCFALAEAPANDVLVDQGRVRLGYPIEAQLLAERVYSAGLATEQASGRVHCDWRRAWREAGERLNAGKVV